MHYGDIVTSVDSVIDPRPNQDYLYGEQVPSFRAVETGKEEQ